MLQTKSKELLQNSKNLLAFSAGIDSTALFFILLENNIPFDIAIVDYGLREQSKEEVAYAKELAQKYNLKCFVKEAAPIERNFEAQAREIRYSFFTELITSRNYDNLLTAHHLGDRFEWLLMQFCKGAGCVELNSMREVELREGYKLLRPLLHLDKSELLSYLEKKALKYFIDASNSDEKYSRNYFRKYHTTPLLEKYRSGIKRSFTYIDEDSQELIVELSIKTINQLAYFPAKDSRTNIYYIDKYLKSIGHIITNKEREELKEEKNIVVGRKYIVSHIKEYIFIAPYRHQVVMDKKFKEEMRLLKIEPKLRGYLAEDDEAVEFLSLLLA